MTRLARLLGYLDADPNNLSLLGDGAEAAFEARDFVLASQLIERCATLGSLPPGLANLAGRIALAEGRYSDAKAIFEPLRSQSDSPGLRFNLAWALASLGEHKEALVLLDEETLAASPHAPALNIHMLHQLGQFEEGLATGEALTKRFPQDEVLAGAIATLALDAERADLALHYARRSGRNAEGRAVLGLLTLQEQDTAHALTLFDDAIAAQSVNARAWLGRGLGLLAGGRASDAARTLERAAELFGTHLGSWVAAGWAYLIAGDRARARASFEHALALDDNFAESHGGLAVIAIGDGEFEEGRRRCDIALRLDKRCFGGALARTLLLERSGHQRAAQAVREMAFATPVGPDGQTLGQAIVAFGLGSRIKAAAKPKRPH